MHFTAATVIAVLAVIGSTASPVDPSHRDNDEDRNNNINIFPDPEAYEQWAICKGKITKARFPNLQAGTADGGCVRYYRGIDMTGVVTEVHFFAKDGINSACDCAIKCLDRPASCTNWVFKHTFMKGDAGKRSCTLYSSPNLPTNVTLAYDLAHSSGFELLQDGNNPQAGAPVPITTLDKDGKHPDKFGVSGFMVQDQNNLQYC
ncbi:hypothetical protein GE09DRAFT_1124757 [Coniochaeta sp. 2T2.1]|nr:hypothetical protein GE09DRAFT_1124757 [Coniochaeta sp. 2T2.1]